MIKVKKFCLFSQWCSLAREATGRAGLGAGWAGFLLEPYRKSLTIMTAVCFLNPVSKKVSGCTEGYFCIHVF